MRLLKLSLITIIVCFSFISFAFAEEKRPNILFIFTDDQAPWAVLPGIRIVKRQTLIGYLMKVRI